MNNSNMYSLPSDGFVFPPFGDVSYNKGLCKAKLFGSPHVRPPFSIELCEWLYI